MILQGLFQEGVLIGVKGSLPTVWRNTEKYKQNTTPYILYIVSVNMSQDAVYIIVPVGCKK